IGSAFVSARRAVVAVADEHRNTVRIQDTSKTDVYFTAVTRPRREVAVAVCPGPHGGTLDMQLVGPAGSERASVRGVWGKRRAAVDRACGTGDVTRTAVSVVVLRVDASALPLAICHSRRAATFRLTCRQHDAGLSVRASVAAGAAVVGAPFDRRLASVVDASV